MPHAPCITTRIDGDAPQALPFDYPVVVKVCSAEIPHKTEVGGVVLNVAGHAGLQAALATLRAISAQMPPAASGPRWRAIAAFGWHPSVSLRRRR